MTVSELIAELQAQDPDAIIVYNDATAGDWHELLGVDAAHALISDGPHPMVIDCQGQIDKPARAGTTWVKAVRF